ncbi:hypothetical protein [Photobacterium damselae]|uniref:hypothetical protein n=1 Tax=Photobacterium damselae TaxID=38293 RepID=UPI0040678FB8
MDSTSDISSDLDLILNMSNDQTDYSQATLADCVFNIVNSYQSIGEKLPYRGFMKLLECHNIIGLNLEYQQFRYLFNLGYLNNFCNKKLFSNSLRKASEIKTKITNLNHDEQTVIKHKIASASLVTLSDLDGWLKVKSQDVATQNIQLLVERVDHHCKGAGGMICKTSDLKAQFYVNLTPAIALNFWNESLRDTTNESELNRTLLRLIMFYYSLIDLSSVLYEPQSLNCFLLEPMYAPLVNTAASRVESLKVLQSHFFSVFMQPCMENIKPCIEKLSNTTRDENQLFELYTMSCRYPRKTDDLRDAYRVFY